ncbi:MAG: GNAT family N-acetyltransferase [Bacteriovoracaceae bacterium]|nr:GNAT family N-acetyltransferase [Bacteriovoracaceae bacterium]
MSEIIFRKATKTDTENLVKLVNSAYRGDSAKAGWTHESDLLEGQRATSSSIQEFLNKKDSVMILALQDKAFVGCVQVEKDNAETCYFGMLTVDPQKQAFGIGKKIMQQIEVQAKVWGCKTIRATVIHTRKELIAYYLRQGYTLTGKSYPFKEFAPDQKQMTDFELQLLEISKKI